MRVIGFCSPSPDEFSQNWDEISFTERVKNFAENENHVIHSINFGDSSTEKQRNTFDQVLQHIRTLKSGFIIAIPDSRHLARELEDAARIAFKVEDLESQIICLDEEYPDFLQNSMAYIPAPGVSLNKSRNIRTAMKKRAISGKVLGKPPFGYQVSNSGNLVPHTEESAIVKEIFRIYVEEDLGLRKITQTLNSKAMKTRSGKDWNIVTIRDILRNTSCIGTYSRFGLRLTNNHEPIIQSSLFRQAQDKTGSRRKYKSFTKSEPYLLSGLCKCGYCGNTMVGVSVKQSWESLSGVKSNNKYRYYKCQSKNNQEICGYHTWPAEKLETRVLDTLKNMSLSEALQNSMSGEDGEMKRMKATEVRLHNVANAEKRFVNFFKKTAIGQSVLGRLKLYLDDLDSCREQVFLTVDSVNVVEFVNGWTSQSFADKRSFLNEYVRQVLVKDRSVKVLI